MRLWLETTLSPVLDAFSVWTIDMRAMASSDPPTQPSVHISKVMHIDSAMFLNGMTALQPQSHVTAGQSNQLSTLLIADSLQGVVYHLNLQILSYSIILNDSATMAPPPNAIPAIGADGLHYRLADGNLYYTNSLRERFNRVPIAITGNPPNVTAAGEYTTIASGMFGDDFALGEDGAAYIAANLMNEVFKVTQKGEVSVVAGGLNGTTIAGDASEALGRTAG